MLNEIMEKLSSKLSKEEVEINMFMRIIQNTCIHLDNYIIYMYYVDLTILHTLIIHNFPGTVSCESYPSVRECCYQ